MSDENLHRFVLTDPCHGTVPCGAWAPRDCARRALPLCLYLDGGGGAAVDSLAALTPALDGAVEAGRIPPMVVATATTAAWSFYLDDPVRGLAWESLIAEQLAPAVCAAGLASPDAKVALAGLSMGGYGALKIAFAQPARFVAVAAVSPMLEPSLTADGAPLRNRYFYPPALPDALLGARRDALLYERDHPALRARAHRGAIAGAGLGIYVDAAGDDALHAHDGAELLHRMLWSLDLPHTYLLQDGVDHVGPALPARLMAALTWLGDRLAPPAPAALADEDRTAQAWLAGDRRRPAPTLSPHSRLAAALLRAQLAPARDAARAHDPSVDRHYGRLPPL